MKKRESHLHDPVKSVVPLREICGTTIRVNLWDTTPCVSCPLQPFLPIGCHYNRHDLSLLHIFCLTLILYKYLEFLSTQVFSIYEQLHNQAFTIDRLSFLMINQVITLSVTDDYQYLYNQDCDRNIRQQWRHYNNR